MSDAYSFSSTRSLGDNLIDSIKGIGIGLVLFVVAFPILWWNEGRTNLGSVAKTAKVVAATPASADGEGKLVAITGPLAGDEALADADYPEAGSFVKLVRDVEQYAWVEHKKETEKKQLGGSTKVTTTYTYELEWTGSPRSTEDFAVPDGHENPSLTVSRNSWQASTAHVGAYAFQPAEIELPPARPVADWRYLGAAKAAAPKLGDVRVRHRAVEVGRLVTVYGQKSAATVVPFMYEGKDKLYRIVDGTHEQAIATLKSEHSTTTWILRLIGFLFIWFGMALVLGPIQAVLDILPFLGSASRFLTGVVLFPVALALAGTTVLVSIVAHNPILLGLVIAGFAVGIGLLIQRAVKRKRAAKAAAGGIVRAA